jgi:hypothetical protein
MLQFFRYPTSIEMLCGLIVPSLLSKDGTGGSRCSVPVLSSAALFATSYSMQVEAAVWTRNHVCCRRRLVKDHHGKGKGTQTV